MFIFLITLLLVLFFINIITLFNYIQIKKDKYNYISKQIKQKVTELNAINNNIEKIKQEEEKIINSISNKNIEIKNIQELIDINKENIENRKKYELELIKQEIDVKRNEFLVDFYKEKDIYDQQINETKQKLLQYKNIEKSIIELQKKEKIKNEQQNFYRLQLDKNNKLDINFLLEIEKNIYNKQILRKLIWSEFLQKPFQELIKRIFGNNIPKNVIYCIEDNFNKKYIGKTSNSIDKRWSDHIKKSLEIDGKTNMKIHKALFNNWDNFSFYILEEGIDKNKLTEQEKYWINFYQSDVVGYNIKGGNDYDF